MTSSPIRGRQAVGAQLTFGEQQQSQAEAREKEQKFKGALNAVAQREEHRRRRGKPGQPDNAEDAPQEGPVAAAPAAGPAGPGRGRILSAAPNSVDARRQALLARVPAGQKKPAPAPVIPRALAEAVTDPRMARPSLVDLQGVETDPGVQDLPPAPLDPFADMETAGAEPLAPAPVNQGDGTSLELLDGDDFFEIDVEDLDKPADDEDAFAAPAVPPRPGR